MKVLCHNQFWHDPDIFRSRVFERFPDVHKDGRGCFSEVLKHETGLIRTLEWCNDLSWIKQVNRSVSKPGVARGMHAQKGSSCQGKLVQAVWGRVLDIIVDARPDSLTFGVSDVFELDSAKQNQLWVPRGFLHGFVTPRDQAGDAVFEYFCDNVYDKAAETGAAPDGFIQKILKLKAETDPSFDADVDGLELSEKDAKADDYEKWMSDRRGEYERSGRLWYR